MTKTTRALRAPRPQKKSVAQISTASIVVGLLVAVILICIATALYLR